MLLKGGGGSELSGQQETRGRAGQGRACQEGEWLGSRVCACCSAAFRDQQDLLLLHIPATVISFPRFIDASTFIANEIMLIGDFPFWMKTESNV